MAHHKDFGGGFTHDEWAGLQRDAEKLSATRPTEAQIAQWKTAAVEAQTALDVCGGNVEMARKLMDASPLETKMEIALYTEFKQRVQASPEVKSALALLERKNAVIERKQLVGYAKALQVKKSGNANMGEFAGYLSTFDLDQGGDKIAPNAFDATIAAAKQRQASTGSPYLWPMLANHSDSQVIGGFTSARTDDKGLFVTGEIDLDTELGKTAWNGMVKQYNTGLSIGYSADKYHYVGSTRMLDQVSLFEGSQTPFPMNLAAGVTRVAGGAGL